MFLILLLRPPAAMFLILLLRPSAAMFLILLLRPSICDLNSSIRNMAGTICFNSVRHIFWQCALSLTRWQRTNSLAVCALTWDKAVRPCLLVNSTSHPRVCNCVVIQSHSIAGAEDKGREHNSTNHRQQFVYAQAVTTCCQQAVTLGSKVFPTHEIKYDQMSARYNQGENQHEKHIS